MSQRQARVLRFVASRESLTEDLPKPVALKFERVTVRRRAPMPRIATEAARLQMFRPDVAPFVEQLIDAFNSEIVPPDER